MIHAHDSPSPAPGLVSSATRLRSGKKDILICMASQNKLETDLLEVEDRGTGEGPVTSRSSKPFEESVLRVVWGAKQNISNVKCRI